MRRKKVTQHISLILAVTLLLQMFVVPGMYNGSITVEAADAMETVRFEDDFEYNAVDALLNSELWDVETLKHKGTTPELIDGVLKLDTNDSVQFNWINVEAIGSYDSTKAYAFEFDATVTDSVGEDKTSTAQTRVLYVAPGGYYNQVEIKDGNGRVRAGDTYVAYDDANYLNQTIHVKLEWIGTTITSTITDAEGTVLATGYRTNTAFNYATSSDSYMETMILRCEDGAVEIDNFVFSAGDETLHTEDFEINPIETMFLTDVWNGYNTPEITDGAITMESGDNIEFNWMEVADIGTYNPEMAYTFEFDAIITNSVGEDKTSTQTRVLYVAPGGYYNQVEIKDKNGKVRTGDTYVAYDDITYLNQTIHVKLEWIGTTITSTITDAEGTVLATGYRTNTAFNYATSSDSYMETMILRCEDGAVQIDNFVFTTALVYETTEQSVTIPDNQQAVYECNVTYSAGSTSKLEMGGTTSSATEVVGELFRISDAGMSIGGYACAGTFEEGTYAVKIYLNPTQEAVNVEVTLPNGGVIRRGSSSLLYSCTEVTKIIAGWRDATEPITDEQVTYADINNQSYTVNSTEPVYEGFEANVYNLVTSFDVDAKTTRTFAWTALETYVGSDAMAVQYRISGADEWQTVDAEKEKEKTEEETEDYFKADITGLTAGTTYEYRIGKTNSTDETNDWSEIHTFTTEAENVDEFSFVTIGDTQGTDWATGRPYMYTQAALNQAVADIENPAFVLHTGDVVQNGNVLSEWNQYFKALGDIGKTIPHFAAIGNHDTYNQSSYNFDLHFNHPNNGGSTAFAGGTVDSVTALNYANANSLMQNLDEATYSFNYGNVHFVVLNSGVYDTAGNVDKLILEGQRAWLKADLEANANAEWTIIMVHQPVYHRKGGTESRPWLYDVIEEYGVDLVLQGHSHLVTRTYPMKNGAVVSNTITDRIVEGTGTVYSTVGSTATNHDGLSSDIEEEIYTVFTPVTTQPTYTTVEVNDNVIKVAVKQVNGLVVDEFKIYKEVYEFTGRTLELGGKIGVNFYVPSNHTLSDEAYVEFELEDGEIQNVAIKDTTETKYGVKFTCWVPAKEMADTITATIYDGGAAKHTVSTTIRDYAETIISEAESNAGYATAKSLVNAMLNYGAYAQQLFSYNTGELANQHEKVEDAVADVTENDLADFAKTKQGLQNFGCLAGTKLVLKGGTSLKMFFTFEEGVVLDDLAFSIDGVQQKYTTSGDYYVVEIPDISACHLNNDYTVTVTAGDYTFDAVTSAMTYCYNALTSTNNIALHNVAKALYLYNIEANKYIAAANYEARIGETYFVTFEEALTAATNGTDATVVNILKDVEVDSVISITSSKEITIQSEGNSVHTISTSNTTEDLFDVAGTLTLNNLNLQGGNRSLYINNGTVNTYGVTIDGTDATVEHLVDNDGGVFNLNNTTIKNAQGTALYIRKEATATVNNVVMDQVGNYGIYIQSGAKLSGEGLEINNVYKNSEISGAEGMAIKNYGAITELNHVTVGTDDSEVTGSGAAISATFGELVNNAIVNDNSGASYSGSDLVVSNVPSHNAFYNKGTLTLTNVTTNNTYNGILTRNNAWTTLSGTINVKNVVKSALSTAGPESGEYVNGITLKTGTTVLIDGTGSHAISNVGSFVAEDGTKITIKNVKGSGINGINNTGTMTLDDVAIDGIYITIPASTNYIGNAVYTTGTINLTGALTIDNHHYVLGTDASDNNYNGNGVCLNGGSISGTGSIEINGTSGATIDDVTYRGTRVGVFTTYGTIDVYGVTTKNTNSVGILLYNGNTFNASVVDVYGTVTQGVYVQNKNTIDVEVMTIAKTTANGLWMNNGTSTLPTVTIDKLIVRDTAQYGVNCKSEITSTNLNISELWYKNCTSGAVNTTIKSGVATPQELTE